MDPDHHRQTLCARGNLFGLEARTPDVQVEAVLFAREPLARLSGNAGELRSGLKTRASELERITRLGPRLHRLRRPPAQRADRRPREGQPDPRMGVCSGREADDRPQGEQALGGDVGDRSRGLSRDEETQGFLDEQCEEAHAGQCDREADPTSNAAGSARLRLFRRRHLAPPEPPGPIAGYHDAPP